MKTHLPVRLTKGALRLCVASVLLSVVAAQAQSIVVASTTSTEQSGLFAQLLPAFKTATGVDVKVVALGTGQVNWKDTFQTLRKIGNDRWLVIEAFGRPNPEFAAATKIWRDIFPDPEDLCREGLEFVRSQWAAT